MPSVENENNCSRRWRISSKNARSAAIAVLSILLTAAPKISPSYLVLAFSSGNNGAMVTGGRTTAARYTYLSTPSSSPISNHDCRSIGVNRAQIGRRHRKKNKSNTSSCAITSINSATIDDNDINIQNITTEDDEECNIANKCFKQDKLVERAKDKEELKAAVQEVKDVAKEVKTSTKKLGKTIAKNRRGILTFLRNRLFSIEMREDIKRRKKHYVSDWTDAFKSKKALLQTIPAILFLYFACLAPAISFGTIATDLTSGSIGVVEFLLSSGLSGMLYSVLSGQPMAFIAPTGLTLAFISGLFRFCTVQNVPFFPIYAWVGIWTSIFMVTLGAAGSSKLIRYCTRFTDEVFNALLSMNFIYEALASLRRNFLLVADPMNLSMPFVSLAMAIGTFWSTVKVTTMEQTILFNKRIRTNIKNFGPVSIIAIMSILNLHPWIKKFGIPTLSRSVPSRFMLAGGRDFLIPFRSIPITARLLCALPAVLLTSLFFMDQNISVRVVNNPDNKLRKGEAYNLDMIALGIVTLGLSLVGLPWMCGATVQSMNHVVAMSHTEFNEETQQLEVIDVTETRTTGFVIHAMIAATIGLLPLLSFLPTPVVAGIFLFLGKKLMNGNSFLGRIVDGISETRRLPDDHPIRCLGRKKMNIFTGAQFGCLLALWGFKQCAVTAIFFPSVIGMLMAIRAFVLPRFFTEEDFVALGDPSP